MRSLERSAMKVVAAVALAALCVQPALAQPTQGAEVALLATTPSGITWTPQVGFGKLVLSVQGDGFASTKEFTGPAHFQPVDARGHQLPDGVYTWELAVIPSALDANNHHYRSDERSADGRSVRAGTAPEGKIQSGAFTIDGGAIVDPGLVESASAGKRVAEQAAEAADVDDSDAANP